jgi:hypothetical protein
MSTLADAIMFGIYGFYALAAMLACGLVIGGYFCVKALMARRAKRHAAPDDGYGVGP